MLSETVGRRRVFLRRRPQISKPRDDASPFNDGEEPWPPGLSTGQGTKAAGVPRATLYRCEKKPEPESRRPRGKRWTSELARAVEDLRKDNPMSGKRKIAVPLRRRLRVKHRQATHPLAVPPGPHALRVDPHHAGVAVAAFDRGVRHDARRTPALCRYFRGHLKMRGVMRVVTALPLRHDTGLA
jgi:hypothetical protein